MSAEKGRLAKTLVGPVPKLLKHSASENHSGRLPEIKPMKQMRSTMDPGQSSDFKMRSSMCRTSSQTKVAQFASAKKQATIKIGPQQPPFQANRNIYKTISSTDALPVAQEKRSMENTASTGFRMRSINQIRNKSQKLVRTMNNVGAALSTTRK